MTGAATIRMVREGLGFTVEYAQKITGRPIGRIESGEAFVSPKMISNIAGLLCDELVSRSHAVNA